MSNGFQSRPKGEPISASGTSVATSQLVLHVVGLEAQRLVQSRVRHGLEFVKGHPLAQDVQHPKRALWSGVAHNARPSGGRDATATATGGITLPRVTFRSRRSCSPPRQKAILEWVTMEPRTPT